MDYGKKYLKYKNKYLQLRKELISQGVDVDKILNEEISKLGNNNQQNNTENNNQQNGGGDNIFITNNELTEMNLTETPNVFDQEGGYVLQRDGSEQDDGTLGPPIPGRPEPSDDKAGIPYAVSPVSPPRPTSPKPTSSQPNPQKSTTNVRNVYNYFDPLYPTYTVPGYNTFVRTPGIYPVPRNTFSILKSNDDFFLDDDDYLPRKSSRKKSKRKSSRKKSKRKSSKRKSSKRKSKRKSSRKK